MNVLVTAIGSMSAECTVSSLKALGVGVVATDIYPKAYHPITKECRAFVQVPQLRLGAESYIAALLEAAHREGCEAVIPLTDPEIDVLSPYRARLWEGGISLYLASDDVIRLARTKPLWTQTLRGCRAFKLIPSYHSFEALRAVYYGRFVAKKENGRSSEGIVFADTETFACGKELEGYIYQPFIEGDIVTVDFACHPKSDSLVLIPRRECLRTKNGAGTVVEILDPAAFRAAVEELVKCMHLTGVMNCEFISAADGLYLMDINPRFSAGISFSKMAGYDFIAADVACYTKPDIPPLGNIRIGDIFVKRFTDFS